MGGRCENHYLDEKRRRERYNEAIQALHTGAIDGKVATHETLREEMSQLRRRWDCALLVLQTRHGTFEMPLDEAEYATEWCIALATEIIDAERAHRSGKDDQSKLELTREWVWERFHDLEAGLRSNGLPRDDPK